MLRRLALLACVWAGITAVLGGPGSADARERRNSAPRHSAMIIDANTGAVLHDSSGDELRHPASLTKMMTLYLTFETIESGRLSFASPVMVSQEAASAAPSNLDLEPGSEISVGDAVRALITKSANDVAMALAEKIGGSQDNFVRLMNAKAIALGMSKTNFQNASGLPDPDQVTTARDMITLGLSLQDDFPQHYPLFAMRSFRYNGASHRNHNTLMNHFAGIDGIKTGYTRASGFNLVSSIRRGGRHLVGAVFGGSSAASRNSEMRTLLTRVMSRASTVKTRKPTPKPMPILISKLKSEPKIAARPAPKPKPASAPEPPLQMAAAPQPKPKAKPAPAAAIAPASAPEAIEEPALQEQPVEDVGAALESAPKTPVAEAVAPAPLEVARVRRVLVEPRQKPVRAAPNPDETTDMAPEEQTIDSVMEGKSAATGLAPTDEPLVSETIITKTAAAARPERGDTQIAMLGAGDIVPPEAVDAPTPAPVVAATAPATRAVTRPVTRPVTATAAVAPAKLISASLTKPAAPVQRPRPAATAKVPSSPIQRGAPPSSLEAQAAALQFAPVQKMAASQPSAAAPAGASHFEIQIGAYASVDEAQRSLTAVQTRTGDLLTRHPSVTHPVTKSGQQVFRARFRGFDANSAVATCQKLRAQSFDCFVMSAE